MYDTWKSGKYGQTIINAPEHGVELLCKLGKNRYEYQYWWKIGTALLNSFDRDIAEQLFIGWSKQDANYDGDVDDIIEKLDTWDKVKERYSRELEK